MSAVFPTSSFYSPSLVLECPLITQLPLESSEEQVDRVVDKWARIAQGLPEDDYRTCMNNVKRVARELLTQIDAFARTGFTKEQLQKQTQIIIEQLELSAEKFCGRQNRYQNERDDVRREFVHIDQNLSMLSLPVRLTFTQNHEKAPLWDQVQQRLMIHPVSESNAKPLAIMSRWSVPSSEGKRAQIEPGELLRIALRNEEKGDRLDVEIVANLLEKSNEAIVWGANKVCGLHPEIGNACSQGKQLAMKGARIVEEHMPDVVKVTAGKLSQMRKEAIQISALHDQQKLGIPEDETLKFHDNLATIGLGALNFVGGTAVGRAIAPIVKSGIAATQLVMPRIPNAHIKKIVKPTPKTPIHLQESLADRLLRSGEESLLQRIPSVHFSEQTFKELAQKANPRIATEHITFYKKGKNFVVRVGKGEHSIVIKAADTYEAFFEAFGSQFFNTLKLKNLRFTPPINVIKDKGRVILVKPYASGKTIESWIHRYIQKKIPLEEVTEAIGQLGKAYDELQRVSIRYGILPSKHQKRFVFHPDFLLEILNDANSALREFRQPRIALTATQISAFSGQWQQSEVLAGFGLGDVGLTNFVYSKTNKNLVYVDGQSLANGINHIGHPLGIIEQDISVLVSDILDVSISNGMSAEQAHCLLDHFLNQLHKPMHPLPLLAGKIDAVERILQGIPLGKSPDLKEVEKFVERINEYIQIMQW